MHHPPPEKGESRDVNASLVIWNKFTSFQIKSSPGSTTGGTAVSVCQIVNPVTKPGLQIVHLGSTNLRQDLRCEKNLDSNKNPMELTFSSTLSASFTTSPRLLPNTCVIVSNFFVDEFLSLISVFGVPEAGKKFFIF